MQAILMVFIGGGLGSLCRYGIAKMLEENDWNFPLATFIANAISCIILGALVGISLKGNMTISTRLLLMTGFCGGFSTFSTFTNETYYLLGQGYYLHAFANIGFSILVCLICIFLGLKISSL